MPLDPLLGDSRYTFFELDTRDLSKVSLVCDAYMEYLDAVYWHQTMKGYHFYNLTPINKELYGKILRKIKYLNPLCPMTTLRILPNKWQNELNTWQVGHVLTKLSHSTFEELKRFRIWLEYGHTHMISNNYQVVRYPMEECPKCKKSDKIAFGDGFFFCNRCLVQTRGRLNK